MILLIWILCLLSVLLHELGHALGYGISGGKAGWRVVVGAGPRIIGTSRFTFRLIPAGGYFVPDGEAETDREMIMMLAGGPLVSLLLSILFGIIVFCISKFVQPESDLYEIMSQTSRFLQSFNFFQFLFTVIPIRYKVVCRGMESDVLQIIKVLKKKRSL